MKSSSTPSCLELLRPHPCSELQPRLGHRHRQRLERHVYFVAETKGSESDQDLREIEKLKIHCAKEHFKAIGEKTVIFETVATYENLQAALSN